MCLIQGAITVLVTDLTFSEKIDMGYGAPGVTVTVTLLFIGLYNISIPDKIAKVITWIAGGTLEGYILSRLLDVWVYDLFPNWHTPSRYLILYICVSIPIFIFAVLAGKLTHTISQKIVEKTKSKKC